MERVNGEVVHFTEAPEIQHFAMVKVSKNDNVYGIRWGNLILEYLRTVYPVGNADAEIVSDGVTYKVLKRSKVTAFYDADGNTLFDVENSRLEKEYVMVMGEGGLAGLESSQQAVEACEESEERNEDSPANGKEAAADLESIKNAAIKKLEKDMKAEKDKNFAEPVIGYLIGRCKEDAGLSQDVLQEHKTWKKCFDYIYGQARKQAVGGSGAFAVRDDVVYEWAEDYYHKDDKKEKARKAAERKKEQEEGKKREKPAQNDAEVAKPKKEPKPKEKPKPQKGSQDMDGQMDIFSIMGM